MRRPTKLFPEIKEIRYEFLQPKTVPAPESEKKPAASQANEIHRVYYEVCGNPKGKPIVFLPGGPGGGLEPKDRRFFDPKKWRIFLIELRGSGKSKPSRELENNTTQHAVSDIFQILERNKIKRAAFFGGSWASCLASVYTITHPETVSGLVLRGIFLGEEEETEDYFSGKLAKTEYAKKAWQRFFNHANPELGWTTQMYYYHQMNSKKEADFRREYFAYEWCRYETCLLYQKPKPEAEIEKEIRSCNFEAWALMEAHYFVHNCFIEDRFIINNASKFPDVPVSIIQGRDDMVCPPKSAHRLHKALPGSSLYMVNAGHSSSEPEILKKLVSEIDILYDKI